MAERPSTWLQTFTGRAVDVFMPTSDTIALADIAVALSRQVRFNGHTREPYTVAEHSVRVALRVGGLLRPCSDHHAATVALAALLHDAAEAYLGDVVQPLKVALGYRFDPHTGERLESPLIAIERRFERAIAGWAGFRPELFADPVIRQADLELLATEKRDLLGPEPKPWGELPAPLEAQLAPPWRELRARIHFVDTFHDLRSGAGLAGHRIPGAGYDAAEVIRG